MKRAAAAAPARAAAPAAPAAAATPVAAGAPSSPTRLLLAVGALALVVRALYLWQIAGAPFFDLRIGDAAAYHEWARRIADGDWIGSGVFYQAPLYPYLLAAIYRVLGDGVMIVRIVQAVMGAASCVLLAFAGASLFGRRGAIAGIGLALYPSAVFLDGLVEKSSLVMFLTAALLALLSMPAERARARRWIGVGAIVGLLALTRENALLLIVPVLAWIAMGPVAATDQRRRRGGAALACVAGCALILIPVGLRNLAVGGEFHLTTSQFGPNFYIGNHPGASGTYEALVEGHGSAADERIDATRLAEQASGRTLSPKEVSSYWTGRALDYVRAQPLDWIRLTARKIALTFNAYEIADTESPYVYAEWSWLLRMLRPFDFGVLLALAIFGVITTARAWRRLWFLYALAATYASSVIVFYVFERYRFPLVLIALLVAAGGFAEVRDAVGDATRKRRAIAWGTAAAIVAVACAHWPLDDPRAARATHYFDIAAAFSKDPARVDQAAAFYRRALDELPGFPAAQFGMGRLLAQVGRTEEAIPYYRAALATWPTHAEARYNLGMALAATGQPQAAAQEFTEALRVRPDDVDTHIAIAKTLIALQQPDQAVDHYRRALALEPTHAKAMVGLGVALTQLGRGDEAIATYQAALALDPTDANAHNNLGWTLANAGRIGEAVPHFTRALELNPTDGNARRNLDQARALLAPR